MECRARIASATTITPASRSFHADGGALANVVPTPSTRAATGASRLIDTALTLDGAVDAIS